MKDFCEIRISVEGMKHQLIHAFANHSEAVQKQIELACDRFLESGQLERQIDDALAKAVQSQLESFFAYGMGRDAIREAVSKAFRTAACLEQPKGEESGGGE